MADGPFANQKRWDARVAEVLRRDNDRCQLQGPRCTGVAVTADHIRSWRFGPEYWYPLENLRAACKRCNSGRRTELELVAPRELPGHAMCPPGAIVVRDMSFGKWWIIDPSAGTCTDVTEPGGTEHAETRGSSEFDW